MAQLSYIKMISAEIGSVVHDLSQLRIAVFRAFPYLYEGSMDYEKEYLKVYVKSKNAFLFAVYDGSKMVGATTCLPLIDETSNVQEPFFNAGINLESVFYFGESILLPEYRGIGLGHRFFEDREAYAHNFETCKITCFCSVYRPENHQLKPVDYQPLDPFWKKRGYQKELSLKSKFEWIDIGNQHSTQKEMIYWTKKVL